MYSEVIGLGYSGTTDECFRGHIWPESLQEVTIAVSRSGRPSCAQVSQSISELCPRLMTLYHRRGVEIIESDQPFLTFKKIKSITVRLGARGPT